MHKLIYIILSSMFSFLTFARNENIDSLCPIKRYIETGDPAEFVNHFKGDTIFFSVDNADNSYFESFKLLWPDTIWLKDRPKNKLPKENKHFKLITHFQPVAGWGVNAHRQYTSGNTLGSNRFILRGSHVDSIPYLGTFNYIILEDVATSKLIKWDYAKMENNGLIIFSPSILHKLSIMIGMDFDIANTDSTVTPVKCTDVAFSISVKPKIWDINLDANFVGVADDYISHNWNPKYYIPKIKHDNLNDDSPLCPKF